MLDVLPPILYTRRGAVVSFCMCEMFTGSWSAQYAHDLTSDRYYTKIVDVRDESTWIYNFL